MVLSVMTKAVHAKTDRQLWYTKAVLAATDVFSFGWLWASNRDAC